VGNLVQVVNTDGAANNNITTTMTYDRAGRKAAMVDPDMGTWRYWYDSAGNLSVQRDARGTLICFFYDGANRLKGKTYPSGGAWCAGSDPGTYDTTYTYDSYDPANSQWGKGQRTGMSDSSGSTSWRFDQRGRMTQETKTVTGQGAFVTQWAYDPADRVLWTKYPGGNSSQIGEQVTTSYTSQGLPTQLTSATNGNYATGLTYNALSQPISMTLGNGSIMRWGYFGLGGDWDASSATVLARYGKLWRLRATTSVGSPLYDNRYGYDNVGNVTVSAEAPRSATNWPTTYSFQDEFNSLDTNNWTFSSYQTIVSDGGNNVLRSQGPGSWTSYFYRGNSSGSGYVLTSGEGLQVRLKVSADNTMANISVEANDPTYRRFGVIHRGKRLTVQYLDNGTDMSTDVARYPADIINNVELNVWYVVRIVLDDSARGFYVEAYKESAPTTRGSYSTPMPAGLSWRFLHYVRSGYAYFDAYREFSTGGMTWTPEQRQSYGYDELDRLTSAALLDGGQGYTGTFSYGASGNLGAKNDSLGNWTYTYSGNPQVRPHAVQSLSNGWSFGYDDNGNQTTRTMTNTDSLVYDAENRLVRVDRAGVGTIASFMYDGDGKRVLATQGGVTTAYVGNYFEWSAGSGRSYYYINNLRIGTRQGATMLYLLGDSLGSTSVSIDASQTATAEMRYKAYGEQRVASGTLPTTYRFTGQRFDESIGLMYYGARYYDQLLGRFVQADTIVPEPGNPQRLNRYAYANNNPLTYTDPTGHFAWIAVGAAVGALVGAASVALPQMIKNVQTHQPLTANIDPGEVANAAVAGAFVGAMAVAAAPALLAGAGDLLTGVGLATNSTTLFSAGVAATGAAGTVGTAIYGAEAASSQLASTEAPVFSRYMSKAEEAAVQDTSLLRGGRPGSTYFTTDKYESATRAQRSLSLPGTPEVRMSFQIANKPEILGHHLVNPNYGQLGGGIEYWSHDPVRVHILGTKNLAE